MGRGKREKVTAAGSFRHCHGLGERTMEDFNLKYFLCVIGMVLVLEGIPYFAFPEKVKSLYLKIQEISDVNLRMLGFMAMVFGLLLVYFGTS
jgi:uncharacterized protein YjeT (DUF2065 family)